jgi:hypothetical protein
LTSEAFAQLLPLLRRTFAGFPAPERRQLGERVKRSGAARGPATVEADVDVERADWVLPLAARLLGLV